MDVHVSKQYAFRLAADGEIAPLPLRDSSSTALRCRHKGEWSLILDSYPFDASPRTFPMQARLLPDKPYRHAEAFLAEMTTAAVAILECRASRD